MKSIITLGIVAAVLALVEAWPKLYNSDGETYGWRLSRRSYCGKQADKCYSTQQCCEHFVCAAFDDYFGAAKRRTEENRLNPEIPGFCVREKDLVPCRSADSCDYGSECIRLGRSQRYCVPRPEAEAVVAEKLMEDQKFDYANTEAKGTLGSSCQDGSDCQPFTEDGKEKLCCQNVKRGRMGIKRQCDILLRNALCITKRK